jgi:hypothetical protein
LALSIGPTGTYQADLEGKAHDERHHPVPESAKLPERMLGRIRQGEHADIHRDEPCPSGGLVPMSTSSIESIAGWSVIAGQRFHWSAGEAGGIDAAAGVRDNPRRQCLHRSIAA